MATKKISELPLITQLSGSNEGASVIPVVVGGTTDQISIEDFSKFVNRYNATTASNTFIGNQIVNGNVTATGNGIFGGNVEVAGMITAQQYNVTYVSSSVQYQSGSTEFGDTADDTHIFTGTVILNGNAIGLGQLNAQTGSQDLVNFNISKVTASIDAHILKQSIQTGSQDLVNFNISKVTASIDAHILGQARQTGSQDLVNFRNSTVTSSLNFATSSIHSFTASQDSRNFTISQITASLNSHVLGISIVTSSIDAHILKQAIQTGSQDLVNFNISKVTASIDAHILKQSTQTGSQDLVNLGISTYTGSQNVINSSVDSHILKQARQTGSQDLVNLGISTYTGSQNVINNSVDSHILGISTYTASATTTNTSIDAHILAQSRQTASQDLVNYQNSIITSSFRNEIGDIEAYTASLKSAIVVNGTSVRIVGELTASRIYTEYITSSVLFVTGSNIIGDQATDKHEFTGSVHINDTLFIKGQAIGLGELNAFTGSQIGKDFTLSKVTASIDAHILKQATQTGSQDLVNLGISTYTGSQNVINTSVDAHILKQSIQTGSQNTINFNISVVTSSIDAHILKQAIQTGSQDLVNLGISTFTGSLRSEVNLIEAYTASMKAAAIVSSSQQVQNYFTFAKTGSANTFYGEQSITGSLRVTGSLKVGDWQHGEGVANTAKLDIRTASDRGLKVTGGSSSDVIITAYRGASDDMVRSMRLQGSDINIYTGDGNANTGSIVASFTTNGLSFESGKGIDFSATANSAGTTTSEILKDYEEGTFTPTVEGSSTAGTGTYTTQQGTYTKIGNLVTINVWVSWSAHTGTGNLQLANYPFTSIGTTNYRASGTFGWVENLTLSANNIVTMAITPSSTKSDVTQYPAGGGAASSVPLDAAANLHYSITYQTT